MSPDNRSTILRVSLLATAFVTGACVLVIELVGARTLAPFFGNGIYTWSAIISITLLALSIGYFIGGRLSDRHPKPPPLWFMIFTAGIWTSLTPLIVSIILQPVSSSFDIRIAVLIACIILFLPNLTLLGGVSPYCIRLLTDKTQVVGGNSGLVFAVSTVGSLIGALVTGFVIIPHFGISLVFKVCGILLMSIGVFGLLTSTRLINKKMMIFVVMSALLIAVFADPKRNLSVELLDQLPSYYGHIQVVKKDNVKMLLVDGIGQNYVTDDGSYQTPYISFMSNIPALISQHREKKNNANALVIGLGAGELPKLLRKDNIITDVVEINPAIVEMTKKHFEYHADQSQTHILDGRTFLEETELRFDYIFMDAFNAEQIAWHLVTKEAFLSAEKRLSENGAFMLNLTSTVHNEDVISIQKTLKSVFPHVRAFLLDENPEELTSIVYIASREPITLSEYLKSDDTLAAFYVNKFFNGELPDSNFGTVYTDDYNPIISERRNVHSLWRKRMREYLNDDELMWLMI